MHSHLLWLGLLADAMGFESLFMEAWRLREKILDMFDFTTGGRIIFSVNCVGGCLKDMDSAMLKAISDTMETLYEDMRPMAKTFLNDFTVQSRLKGLGVMDKQTALMTGAVGPMLRASGEPYDARLLGYAAYNDLDVQPVTETDGDSYARCKVRIKELFQTYGLLAESCPEGDEEAFRELFG